VNERHASVAVNGESPRQRWKRRSRTIPAVLGATVAALCVLPLAVIVAAIWDTARFRRRLPTARMLCFLLQYLVNDSVEILLAAPLWLGSGCGLVAESRASRARYERVQAWSIRLLARRARQLLGVRLDIDPAAIDALAPGPAIVLCRHVSALDTALPSLLYQTIGFHSRGVIMAELLADPGFDLLYHHAGSVFIARDNDPEARVHVASIAHDLDARTVAVIFPEGRLFRRDVLRRSSARLSERDPERAARLAGLEHVLPPRPAGVNALLDAAPDADVVIINHAFDVCATLGDLIRRVPLEEAIAVDIRRVPRADIPGDPDGRVQWLDEVWCDMNDWLHRHRTVSRVGAINSLRAAPPDGVSRRS
jgi:1-acyl-sn-glycerol-3-phosphate acyltransferase